MRTNKLFSMNITDRGVWVYRDSLIHPDLPLICKFYERITYSTAKRIRRILLSRAYMTIESLAYHNNMIHPEVSIYNEKERKG